MFDGLTPKQKLKRAIEIHKDSDSKDGKFRRAARESFAFWRGPGQWTQQEREILNAEQRHAHTYNLTKRFIDLVLGIYEDYAVQYFASPKEPTDALLAEVLNNVYQWVYNAFNFESEILATRESTLICGRGHCAIDFQIDPKNLFEKFIKIFLNNIPYHEFQKDPASRKKDYSDAAYEIWDKWIQVEDFKVNFPDFAGKVEDYIETGEWIREITDLPDTQTVWDTEYNEDVEEREFDRPIDSFYWDKSKKLVRICHIEYWQAFKRYYGFNPQSGKVEEFDKKSLPELKKVFPSMFGQEFDYFTVIDKKVKWLQFFGKDILYDDDSPVPYDNFSISSCVAFKDVSGKNPEEFGLVDLIKDPQKDVNKRISQGTNLINNQVQPGAYMELDAVVDQGQAEASMKEPGGITYLKSGGLTKIRERGVPKFPNAAIQMEELSQNMMMKIIGINPEVLGMDTGRQEAGVVVRLRREYGIVPLRPLFMAFSVLDKGIFERTLSIIVKKMSDQQVLEILGQNNRYSIQNGIIYDQQLQRQTDLRNLRTLKYNIESREIPGNRSYRMFMLSTLLEMQNNNFPVDPMQIIEKLDISETEKQRWMQYIQGIQQAQAEAAQRDYELKMAEIQSRTATDSKKIESDSVIKMVKVKEQKAKDEGKRNIEQARMQMEDTGHQLEYLAADKKSEIDRKRLELDDTKAQLDFIAKKEKLAVDRKKADAAMISARKTANG